MTWNWVDVIVLVFLLRGAYVGRRDGLSVELVKLATVFVTYYCAIKYYARCALWITVHSRVPMSWATVICFLGIAVLSLVTVWIFFKLLGKVVTLQFESRISTGGGLLIGTTRALVVSSLFLFSIFFVPDAFVKKQVYANSWWGRIAIDATPKVYARFSTLIEGAQQSSKAMNAHFRRERAKMDEILNEEASKSSAVSTEAAPASPIDQVNALVAQQNAQTKEQQVQMEGIMRDMRPPGQGDSKEKR